MKKLYTLLFLLSTITAFSQAIDYKKAPLKKGSNYYDVVNTMRASLVSAKKSKSKSDIKKVKQFERWAFYWRDRVDADGNFPNELEGWYNAGILDANGKINSGNAQKNNASKLSGETWTNIGPQTVPDANGYPNAPQMGRLTNFLRYKHPTDDSQNVLFVSAPVGGVWKSTDNGTSWTPKLDHLAGIGVTDIKSSSTDINNPGTIYVSTGDYDADHIKSIGVLKSTNFGETYQSTTLSFSLSAQESTSNLIVIDANTVVVGTNQYIKKTTDGGGTWTNAYTHDWNDAQLGKFHRNGNNIMCGDSWNGLYYSKDSGDTWAELQAKDGSGQKRHAITSNAAGLFYIQNKAGQVFTCDLSVPTPALTTLGSPTTNYKPQGAYNQALVVKNGLVISGGVDAINSDNNGTGWYTTLNNAWTDNSSDGSYGHADIHEMGYLDAGYNFWMVNDGGLIYVTYPTIGVEKPTVEYKSDGVIVTQIYSVAISPQSEDHIIMGNQDNDGYSQEMRNGSLKWVSALAGDGTCTAIDYTNSNIRYLGAQNSALRRTDTGFTTYDAGVDLTTPTAGAPFVWTLKMNSTIPTTLYGGFADVHKTTNKGATWTNLNSAAGQIEYIETFGNNLLVIGGTSAKKSIDDGVNWTTLAEPDATARMNSLSIDQTNISVIYATVRGYNNGSKVYKSIDGGANWTNISTGLPNVKMTQVVLKQNQGQEILFAGTEIGIYVKVGSANWEKLGQGLPNVNISDIEINYTVDKLVAGTYGRGLWEISINNNTLGVDELNVSEENKPIVYPNPVGANNNLKVKLSAESNDYDFIIYNVVGGLVKKGKLNAVTNTIDITGIVSGIYVLRMTSGKYATSEKIIIK